MHRSAKVALVGPEYERSENLALRVLAAALLEAGHQPVIIPVNSPSDFSLAAQTIAQLCPQAVGLSIAYEGTAWLLTSLVEQLRRLGLPGPIVAGGAFATLHPALLLQIAPLLDGVVRHDGERAIVRLAEVGLGRAQLNSVPGIVLRQGLGLQEGAPCDFSRIDLRPLRSDRLPRHLGIPAADVVTSRGCTGSCSYCCLAAVRADARSRCSDPLLSHSVAGVRRREVGDIADELAELHSRFGAGIFCLQDDSALADEPEEALEQLKSLTAALDARKVRPRALSLKIRGEVLTREIAGALSALGVVRVFAGIEALTPAIAHKLGRRGSSLPLGSLCALANEGISVYFNSLCVGPEVTLEEVDGELCALARLREIPFEIVRVVAYSGTPLEHRLRAQGRLEGGALHRRYRYSDDRVEQLAAALERIETRHFGRRCPTKRLADLQYNVALARRFYPTARLASVARRLRTLISRVNAEQVTTALALSALVGRGVTAHHDKISSVVLSALRSDAHVAAEIVDLTGALEKAVEALGVPEPRAFFRGQFAVPVAMSALLALAGCSGNSSSGVVPGSAGSAGLDAASEVKQEAAADTTIADIAIESQQESAVDATQESLQEASLDVLQDSLQETSLDVTQDPAQEPVLGDATLEAADSPQDVPLEVAAEATPEGPGCAVLSETICAETQVHQVPTFKEQLAFRNQFLAKCGEYGYFKATVEVDATGCGVLTKLEDSNGVVDPTSQVFSCVQATFKYYNLFCFAGQTVVFEDPGPVD